MKHFCRLFKCTHDLGSGAGKALCGQIKIAKNVDKVSPFLIEQVFTSVGIASGKVSFVENAFSNHPVEKHSVALYDVLVTSVEQTELAGKVLGENVSLTASAFTFSYQPLNGAAENINVHCSTGDPPIRGC
jgi:type VI protein secretion system component Hcp